MAYRRCVFYVMTGTGNSYRVASWMAEVARAQGTEARVVLIEAARPEQDLVPGPEELLVVVHPAHGFTAPWHLIKFLWRLPRTRGSHAACLATRAGVRVGPFYPWGAAASGPFVVAALLALAGYRVRGLGALNMPSNWMSLHTGLPPRNVEDVKANTRPQAEAYMAQLVSGRTAFLSVSNVYEAVNAVWLSPISILYLLLGRVMLAKLFHANSTCNGCSQCADTCPISAIEMRGPAPGRPFWLAHCESCMRCMGYCAKKSVEASHSFLLLATLLSIVPIALWFAVAGFTALTGNAEWDILVVIVVLGLLPAYPLMIAAYLAFHWLIGFPAVNRLFTLTTLTHYYRRYHEPETRLRVLRPPREPVAGE